MLSSQVDSNYSVLMLINQLAIILRTAQIHSANNAALTGSVDKFVSMVNELISGENTVSLKLRGYYFYLNDQRVRYSTDHLSNYDYLIGELKKTDLGTISFEHEINPAGINTFIHAFSESLNLQDPFEFIEEKIAGVSSIIVKRIEIDSDEQLDIRKMVRKTYFNAVSYVRGVFSKIKSGEEISIKKAKRVVTSVVSSILEYEQILLGMTAIKDYDEYTYYHCTNVSILSVALGQRLGFNRKMLVDLGVASLFHDLGKIEVPNEVLNKPTSLTESDWRIIKSHPWWGVQALLKMRHIDDLTIRSVFVAFEHHMNLDLSGYPRMKETFELDLFSKIVSLADRYDAMTSNRVYTKKPMPLDRALGILMEQAGDQLDPLLFKFFVNMVGVYPVGTLVKLSSNELGLVFENNQLSLLRPRVMLITDQQGNWIKGKVVDLLDKCEKGEYVRTITNTMDPGNYNINIAEYLY